jgi:hypothetical protein
LAVFASVLREDVSATRDADGLFEVLPDSAVASPSALSRGKHER